MDACAHMRLEVPPSTGKKDASSEKSGWFVFGAVLHPETLTNRFRKSGTAQTVAPVCVFVFECVCVSYRVSVGAS